jgi:hypothetical protein
MVHIRGVVSPPFFEGSCIGGHKKGRGIGEVLEQEKNIVVPNMAVLWG